MNSCEWLRVAKVLTWKWKLVAPTADFHDFGEGHQSENKIVPFRVS